MASCSHQLIQKVRKKSTDTNKNFISIVIQKYKNILIIYNEQIKKSLDCKSLGIELNNLEQAMFQFSATGKILHFIKINFNNIKIETS